MACCIRDKAGRWHLWTLSLTEAEHQAETMGGYESDDQQDEYVAPCATCDGDGAIRDEDGVHPCPHCVKGWRPQCPSDFVWLEPCQTASGKAWFCPVCDDRSGRKANPPR